MEPVEYSIESMRTLSAEATDADKKSVMTVNPTCYWNSNDGYIRVRLNFQPSRLSQLSLRLICNSYVQLEATAGNSLESAEALANLRYCSGPAGLKDFSVQIKVDQAEVTSKQFPKHSLNWLDVVLRADSELTLVYIRVSKPQRDSAWKENTEFFSSPINASGRCSNPLTEHRRKSYAPPPQKPPEVKKVATVQTQPAKEPRKAPPQPVQSYQNLLAGTVFYLDMREEAAARLYRELAAVLGVQVVDTFEETVQMIVSDGLNPDILETGQALGLPVVSVEWLHCCLETRKRLDAFSFSQT